MSESILTNFEYNELDEKETQYFKNYMKKIKDIDINLLKFTSVFCGGKSCFLFEGRKYFSTNKFTLSNPFEF